MESSAEGMIVTSVSGVSMLLVRERWHSTQPDGRSHEFNLP